MTDKKELKKLEEDLVEITQSLARIRSDLDWIINLEFSKCRFCEYWHYDKDCLGECTNKLSNYGDITHAEDSCEDFKMLQYIRGREQQLIETQEEVFQVQSQELDITEEEFFYPNTFTKIIKQFREQGCSKIKIVGHIPEEPEEAK